MTAGVANVAAFEAQLVAQVVDSLAMYMMENARFMAERLHAEFPKEVMMSILYHVWDLVLWDQTGPVHSLAHPCPTPSLTRLIHSCPCRATHTCWEFVTSGVIRHIQHTRSCEVCSPIRLASLKSCLQSQASHVRGNKRACRLHVCAEQIYVCHMLHEAGQVWRS